MQSNLQCRSVVEIENAEKIFRRDKFQIRVLDNVSLRIEAGDFVALMGPSGSGKTTLLNMIAGIERPTAGTLKVMDKNVFEFGDGRAAQWRNETIGYVFQTFNLIPVLTAYENVELPLMLSRLNNTERKRHVMAALRLVGLEDRVHHLPKQLSGGQEQRVAIARSIVTDPAIILADEPTGDLDSASAGEVLTILQGLSQNHGKTIVMVTHDPNAAAFARRIVHLDKGRLRAVEQNELTPLVASRTARIQPV
jgi:putative ABC transport system ATP-binding protein